LAGGKGSRTGSGLSLARIADALGEWIAITSGDIVEFLGESRGLGVGQVKVHYPQIGRLTRGW
jgi:hypothetical protein